MSSITTAWRFWAALPADVHSVVFLGAPGKTTDGAVLALVPRPTFPPGVCTGCGCTEDDACVGPFGEGCAWTDRTCTRCTSCAPRRARRSA